MIDTRILFYAGTAMVAAGSFLAGKIVGEKSATKKVGKQVEDMLKDAVREITPMVITSIDKKIEEKEAAARAALDLNDNGVAAEEIHAEIRDLMKQRTELVLKLVA